MGSQPRAEAVRRPLELGGKEHHSRICQMQWMGNTCVLGMRKVYFCVELQIANMIDKERLKRPIDGSHFGK